MLKQGDTGSRVRRLQRELTQIAVRQRRPDINPQGIDGIFGRNTRAAVINFQTAVGLRPTGVVDRVTQAAITRLLGAEPGAIPAAPTPTPTPTRPVTPRAVIPTRPAAPLPPPPVIPPTIDWKTVGIGAAIVLMLLIMASSKDKKK
ncbi:MAG: hypothetical protein DDT18_01833 [Actinobacteria bacterium]|nr:hypothetical protein [Actinomycetota bacterium]